MQSKKAFTLIELLLVVAIVAFLFALSAKIFVKKKTRVKNTFNEFIQLNNRLSRSSKLNKQSYRLVFNLSTEEPDQYWVEKKISGTKQEDLQNADPGSHFQMENSFYPETQTLIPLLDIVQIEQKEQKGTEGLVYIYYYPSALAQETKIYLLRPDTQAEWILYLDPVSKELSLLK